MNIYEKVLKRVKANLGSIQAQIRAKALSTKEIQTLFSSDTLSEQSRDQKQFGTFYTPPAIAQYYLLHTLQKDFRALRILFLTTLQIHDYGAAIKVIENFQAVTILDPSCGSGIFLIHALRCLYGNWLTLQKDWKNHIPISQEIRVKWDDAKKTACKFLQTTLMIPAYTPQSLLTNIILNQLYGVDSNVEAIIETQVNLWMEAVRLAPDSFLLLSGDTLEDHLPLPDISLNFSAGDAIVTLPNRIVLPSLETLASTEIRQLTHLRKEYIAQCSNPDKMPDLSRIIMLQDDLRKKLTDQIDDDNEHIKMDFLEMVQGDDLNSPIWWGIQFAHLFFNDGGLVRSESNRGFSYVLGNPPYIHQKGSKDAPKISYEKRAFFRHYYQSADSSDLITHGGVKMNSFTLFLEQSVRLMRPGGTLALLLHKNFLTVESYQKSRKYLLDHTQILEIVDVGAHIFPQITGEIIFIIATKNMIGSYSPSKPHKIHIIPSIQLGKNYKIIPRSTHLTPQNLFLSPPNYIFHLHLSPENVEIRKIIVKNSQALHQYAKISSYGLNVKPQFISPTPQEGWVPAIRGKHIGRYLIKIPLWILYSPESLTRPGNLEAFQAPEKLVMQRIGGNFAAAYDDQQRYVFNSVNMILPRSSSSSSLIKTGVSLKYILAIINSTLIRYYIRKFFTMDAVFTINITKGFLETLPIPACPPSIQDQILKLVTSLEQNQYLTGTPLSSEHLARIYQENLKSEDMLDRLIFGLYGLKSDHIHAILSQM